MRRALGKPETKCLFTGFREEQCKASLIGAFMLARGVSRRRKVQIAHFFGYKNSTAHVPLHSVSRSLGSCADIRSQALVTGMGFNANRTQDRVIAQYLLTNCKPAGRCSIGCSNYHVRNEMIVMIYEFSAKYLNCGMRGAL